MGSPLVANTLMALSSSAATGHVHVTQFGVVSSLHTGRAVENSGWFDRSSTTRLVNFGKREESMGSASAQEAQKVAGAIRFADRRPREFMHSFCLSTWNSPRHFPLFHACPEGSELFCKLAEKVARANITPTVIEAIRMGRMTALRKANGGVRGIVVGDVRRLVARTTPKLVPQVEAATALFQYALSTCVGSVCVAHVIQGLCEVNPDSTVMSIDGLSACDQISRAAMMDGLSSRCGGEAIPFVRMFCGSPSKYIWEDGEGVEHSILQGGRRRTGGSSNAFVVSTCRIGGHPGRIDN